MPQNTAQGARVCVAIPLATPNPLILAEAPTLNPEPQVHATISVATL
jgi:hypothetical protein